MFTSIRNAFPFLVLFSAFHTCLFTACQKEEGSNAPTVFNITVVDSKSGRPVPKAYAIFGTLPKENPSWDKIISESVFADSLGRFTYTLPSDRSMVHFQLAGDNHLTRINFVKAKEHETNNLTIPLIPADAILKLTIDNQTGATNQFYLAATSPTVLKEIGRNYVLYDPKVVEGKQASYSWRFPSGEYATLYFGTKNFISPINFGLADKVDSVFLKPGDTTSYEISF